MNLHDAELLSAYLDGQLSPAERSRLETRMASDAKLRAVLEELRETRGILRQLPRLRAPRRFTLSPLDARLRAPVPAVFPVLRLASVVASLLFLSAVALNAFPAPAAQRTMTVQSPAYGIGGGPGEGPSAADAAAPAEALATALPQQSVAAPEAMVMPTGESAATPVERLAAPAAPPGESAAKTAPPAANQLTETVAGAKASIPVLWEVVLGSAAALFGVLAWYLRHSNQRNFRSRWLEK